MTYVWEDAEGEWIVIDRERTLIGHVIDGVVDDWRVTPAGVAALTPEQRAARGYLEVVETEPAVGRRVVGSRVEGSPPTRAWLTEAFTPEETAELKANCVTAIKAEARQRIVAVMNKDQQDNALARGQEMIFLHGADAATWPQAARDEYTVVMAKWSQIKALREASDAIEAALPDDPEALSAFSAATANGWPA